MNTALSKKTYERMMGLIKTVDYENFQDIILSITQELSEENFERYEIIHFLKTMLDMEIVQLLLDEPDMG